MDYVKEDKLKKRKLANEIVHEITRVTEKKLVLISKNNNVIEELRQIEIYRNYIDKLDDLLSVTFIDHFTKIEIRFKEIVNYEI